MMFDLAASIAEENKAFDVLFENYKALTLAYDSKEDLKEVMKRFEKVHHDDIMFLEKKKELI